MDCNSSVDAQFSLMTCGPVAVGVEGLRPTCFYSSHFLSSWIKGVCPPGDGWTRDFTTHPTVFIDSFPRGDNIFFWLFLCPYSRAELMHLRIASQSSAVMSGEQASDGLGGGDAVKNV